MQAIHAFQTQWTPQRIQSDWQVREREDPGAGSPANLTGFAAASTASGTHESPASTTVRFDRWCWWRWWEWRCWRGPDEVDAAAETVVGEAPPVEPDDGSCPGGFAITPVWSAFWITAVFCWMEVLEGARRG
jgi:hypothetical protein